MPIVRPDDTCPACDSLEAIMESFISTERTNQD